MTVQEFKALMKTHKLGCGQVAGAAGLKEVTIERIVNGETRKPHASTMKVISDAVTVLIRERKGLNPGTLDATG